MIDDLWYRNAVFYCLSVGSPKTTATPTTAAGTD